MSYDLAVWEGARPADDAAAAAEFEALYARYIEPGDPAAPTARIAAYVTALLERYPDTDDDSPWSAGLDHGSGPLVYVPMVWSRSGEVSAWAAELAERHGLHCYDPQTGQLRTSWGRPWRFELTSAHGRTFRDPDADDVRSTLTRLSADMFYAVLGRSDEWYIQVGYGERAGTRPGWYALERRDGSPERHYRAETTSIEDAVRAFTAFLEDDPTLPDRFAWRPFTV